MAGASAGWSGRKRSRSVVNSTAIVGIDLDVAMGEVAGPDPRLAGADADIDFDLDVAGLDVLGDRRFVVISDALALGGDQHAADLDGQLVALGLLAGLADRHDDAAPIRVLSSNCGLDQRRIGDR